MLLVSTSVKTSHQFVKNLDCALNWTWIAGSQSRRSPTELSGPGCIVTIFKLSSAHKILICIAKFYGVSIFFCRKRILHALGSADPNAVISPLVWQWGHTKLQTSKAKKKQKHLRGHQIFYVAGDKRTFLSEIAAWIVCGNSFGKFRVLARTTQRSRLSSRSIESRASKIGLWQVLVCWCHPDVQPNLQNLPGANFYNFL